MTALWLAATLAAWGGVAPSRAMAPDTLVEVRRGDTLVLRHLLGVVTVRAWDGDAVGVEGWRGGALDIAADREGGTVGIAPATRRPGRLPHDLIVRVPRWLSVDVRGRSVDVSVEGVRAGVHVETVTGHVRVSDTRGLLEARTVEGEVSLRDVEGTVAASSIDDDVRVSGVRGSLSIRTGDGDLVVEGANLERLRAETLDGDVVFAGRLRPAGRYEISVHDGNVEVRIPPDSDVTMRVSTFDGEFASAFPVTLKGFRAGDASEFTLGDGGAEFAIEVFDGDIHLATLRDGGR